MIDQTTGHSKLRASTIRGAHALCLFVSNTWRENDNICTNHRTDNGLLKVIQKQTFSEHSDYYIFLVLWGRANGVYASKQFNEGPEQDIVFVVLAVMLRKLCEVVLAVWGCVSCVRLC